MNCAGKSAPSPLLHCVLNGQPTENLGNSPKSWRIYATDGQN